MARVRARHPRGLASRGFADLARGRRIGVLGGSFNPAHAGHAHISRLALRRLRLDVVWWMVSPQNPLKPADGMAAQDERVRMARALASDPRRIVVTDIESVLGTTYTADTLRCLRARFRGRRFVWLMGADNLDQIPRWRGWTSIFRTVPIAVFARPTYSRKALSGKASARFRRSRLPQEHAGMLAAQRPPRWVFLACRLHGASATAIRNARGGSPG